MGLKCSGFGATSCRARDSSDHGTLKRVCPVLSIRSHIDGPYCSSHRPRRARPRRGRHNQPTMRQPEWHKSRGGAAVSCNRRMRRVASRPLKSQSVVPRDGGDCGSGKEMSMTVTFENALTASPDQSPLGSRPDAAPSVEAVQYSQSSAHPTAPVTPEIQRVKHSELSK
jgi:hypothetical protein